MVNFSHDSYDKCDDFDFHIVNFPYLSSIFQNPLHMVFFVSQLIRYARLVQNMKIFCSEDLFWFQSY